MTLGKKDVLCQRIIDEVPHEELAKLINERYWRITEKGQLLLDENPYIEFYLTSHPYNLESVGISLADLSKLYMKHSDKRIRDLLWGEFNRKSSQFYSNAISNGEFGDYCDLLSTMALFLEEEGRHRDALAMFLRYLHYQINFEAGMKAIKYYQLIKKVNDASDYLYSCAMLYPFCINTLLDLSNECGFDSTQLKECMNTTFNKENDKGIFTPEELTNFIMDGLNGDEDSQRKICKNAMKQASKKIPVRK